MLIALFQAYSFYKNVNNNKYLDNNEKKCKIKICSQMSGFLVEVDDLCLKQ